MLKGARRLAAPSLVRRRDPITPRMLREMNALPSAASPAGLSFVAISTLAVCGLFRAADLVGVVDDPRGGLRRRDVTFTDGDMRVFLHSSKTDQFAAGATIIFPVDSPTAGVVARIRHCFATRPTSAPTRRCSSARTVSQ
jgi:hypothetical protein